MVKLFGRCFKLIETEKKHGMNLRQSVQTNSEQINSETDSNVRKRQVGDEYTERTEKNAQKLV